MLSASEIGELEKKVFYYRIKKKMRYISFFGVLFLCLGGLLLFYVNPSFIFKQPVKTSNDTTIKEETVTPSNEKNATTTVAQAPIVAQTVAVATPLEHNISKAKEKEPEETLMLRSPTVSLGKETTKPATKQEDKRDYLPAPVEEERVVSREMPPENFYRSKEESIDTTVLAPPSLDTIKPKGVIKIESQEINSIQYLKEKFEKTNNIIFALMLAEEYYIAKDYVQSNKWALIANQLDSENEKSWLWFAKSKVKLGHKDDAIVALKAYLKHNKSTAVQTLLNQINLGEVHE